MFQVCRAVHWAAVEGLYWQLTALIAMVNLMTQPLERFDDKAKKQCRHTLSMSLTNGCTTTNRFGKCKTHASTNMVTVRDCLQVPAQTPALG
jgi:hypothetical protein